MEKTQSRQASDHIIILPSPGAGHLFPLVEFAKQLLFKHQLSVTITVPSNSNTAPSEAEISILKELPEAVNSVFLSPVNLDDLPAETEVETIIFETVSRSCSFLRDAFIKILTPGNSTHHIAALVVDVFGTDAFDVANEFQVLPFIFHPSTATCLSLFFHLHELDRLHSGEFRDLTEPVNLPGCPAFKGTELIDPMQDRKSKSYKWLLHMAEGYKSAKGVLVNSFYELESRAFDALSMPENCYPPVYPVGPLIRTKLTSSNDSMTRHYCVDWLDHQPVGSVLYVCLGSGGTLSHKQIIELAYGLEKAEHRFLWVLKSPNAKSANATSFGEKITSTEDSLVFLPEGFLERTEGLGLVVRSWAPQIQVLSHGSTGGFLSHCGWNSTLEGVCNGVPFIAWPLYAEQRMNARMLVDELKIALRPKAEENGLVGRVEIARVVKGLMEGEDGKRVTSRVGELKSAAQRVLGDDGCSTKALAEVVNKWKNHKNSTHICK